MVKNSQLELHLQRNQRLHIHQCTADDVDTHSSDSVHPVSALTYAVVNMFRAF